MQLFLAFLNPTSSFTRFSKQAININVLHSYIFYNNLNMYIKCHDSSLLLSSYFFLYNLLLEFFLCHFVSMNSCLEVYFCKKNKIPSKHHNVVCIYPLVSIAAVIFIWQCSYFENITLLLLSWVHSTGQPLKGSWVFLMLLFYFVFYMDILKFSSFFFPPTMSLTRFPCLWK